MNNSQPAVDKSNNEFSELVPHVHKKLIEAAELLREKYPDMGIHNPPFAIQADNIFAPRQEN